VEFIQITRSLFRYLISDPFTVGCWMLKDTYKDLLQFRKSASNHSKHQEDPLGSCLWNMLQPLNSRLAAVVVVVVVFELGFELGVERNLVASSEQETVMRWDMLVEAVGQGPRVKWLRDLVVGVASVPDHQRMSGEFQVGLRL